jgi:hypothetical protein
MSALIIMQNGKRKGKMQSELRELHPFGVSISGSRKHKEFSQFHEAHAAMKSKSHRDWLIHQPSLEFHVPIRLDCTTPMLIARPDLVPVKFCDPQHNR